MARTKPPEQLKPRTIRLSDSEMFAFRSIGGTAWLRNRLHKLRVGKRLVAIRNRSMRIDYLAGVSQVALARKYNVERTTVWRITKDLKNDTTLQAD